MFSHFDMPLMQNPLDFLDEDQFMPKRKPRSSIESSDRQIEIPVCQPAYISRHLRDSGRAYDPIESFSPQPVNRKPLFKLGSFMDNDTFDEDVDFLFQDHQDRTPRQRKCSDTNFSINMLNSGNSNYCFSQKDEEQLDVMLIDTCSHNP